MLKWPERAKSAIKKLFEPLQDIDVYVEDTNDEAFYKTLLNTVSQGKVEIARVFALGGREPVIEAARNHDHSRRRALFIIDGDLEWVRGLHPPKIVGLHRHDAYCIENLLFCENALVKILSQDAILTEEDARQRLDIKGWINSIQDPLIALFSAFATAHAIIPEIKTVSRGVGKLCTANKSNGVTTLDNGKVSKAATDALASAESKTDNKTVMTLYNQILTRLKSLQFPLNAVSGKDYLLPLLNFLLQSHGCKIRHKSLRMRLASTGDINRFSSLFHSLQNAALGISR